MKIDVRKKCVRSLFKTNASGSQKPALEAEESATPLSQGKNYQQETCMLFCEALVDVSWLLHHSAQV